MKKLVQYLSRLNVHKIVEIKPSMLVFDASVREACAANKCTRYNRNFMCPPHIGEIHHHQNKMSEYDKGLLIYMKDTIHNPDDQEAYYLSADRLHEVLLSTERAAEAVGFQKVRGYIAGHCRLCDPCGAEVGLVQCIRPEEARTSMEAIGIDVIETCKLAGYPIGFVENEVTWVALLLLGGEHEVF